MRTIENSIYDIYDLLGIKLPNRLRLGFCHLREHKFRHNLADDCEPIMPMFFKNCKYYVAYRTTLNELNGVNNLSLTSNSNEIVITFLYGDKKN